MVSEFTGVIYKQQWNKTGHGYVTIIVFLGDIL